MSPRSVPEWIGKTPDAAIPKRVQLRIFERYDGKCYITGTKLTPGTSWQFDHIVALVNGGEHRESNLAPALTAAHKGKTKDDVAEKSEINRMKAKHFGIGKKKSKFRGWRKMDGSIVWND